MSSISRFQQPIHKDKPRRAFKEPFLAIIKNIGWPGLLIVAVQGIHWANLVTGIRSPIQLVSSGDLHGPAGIMFEILAMGDIGQELSHPVQ